MNDTIISLDRHIMEEQRRYGGRGEFSAILSQIVFAAKVVAAQVAHAGIVEESSATSAHQCPGEEVQKLDVYANKLFINALNYIGKVCVMASEEEKDMIMIPADYPKGDYVVMFDPLDGSTNIDVNVSIGTIFGIYRRVSGGGDGTLEDCLQAGRKLFGAGYNIYSSSTILVYSRATGSTA
jgi:fructose-1,6-bisphosphatase I